MRVLISGYYGFGNVGDEAVLQSIVQGLRKRDQNIAITVFSKSPHLTQERYEVDSVYYFDLWQILSAMWQTDVLLSGGGTLLQNATSRRSFIYYLALIALAKLFRKKVMIFAQGFGPLRKFTCRPCVRAVLNQVDLIALRDQESVAKLKELGLRKSPGHLTADPTLTLIVPAPEQAARLLNLEGIKKGEKPLLGIALRSFTHGHQAKTVGILARAIDWLAEEHHFYPVFILFQAPQDMLITSQVANFMRSGSSVVFRVCKPDEMLALVSQFDLLVGMRLHSLIFAVMNRVPMLGLSYDPKVGAFMRRIDQPCLALDDKLDLIILKQNLDLVLSNREKIKAELAVKKAELSRLAELNFELYDKLCGRKS